MVEMTEAANILQQRDAREPGAHGRDRPRHEHLRRPVARMGLRASSWRARSVRSRSSPRTTSSSRRWPTSCRRAPTCISMRPSTATSSCSCTRSRMAPRTRASVCRSRGSPACRETCRQRCAALPRRARATRALRAACIAQQSLELDRRAAEPAANPCVDELARIDPDSLTPRTALELALSAAADTRIAVRLVASVAGGSRRSAAATDRERASRRGGNECLACNAVSRLGALHRARCACNRLRRDAATGGRPVDVTRSSRSPLASTEIYRDLVGEVRGSQEVEIRSRVSGVLLEEALRRRRLVDRGPARSTASTRASTARSSPTPRPARLRRGQPRARAAGRRALWAARWPRTRSASRSTTTPSPPPSRPRPRCEASRAAISEARLGVEYADSARAADRADRRVAGVRGRADHRRADDARRRSRDDDPAWVYFSLSESRAARLPASLRHCRAGAGQPAARRAPDAERRHASYPQPGRINFADRALDRPPAPTRCAPSSRTRSTRCVPGLFARIRVTAEKRAGRDPRARSRRAAAARPLLRHRRRRRTTRPKRAR